MSIIDMSGFCRKAEENHVLGVVVQQHGKEIARQLWDDERRRDVYSVTKSFTSAAVGIAQREGLLSLDEKLTDAFAEDLPDFVSPHLEKASVRDLLTMCLGQGKPFLMGADRPFYPETDWVKLALAQPWVCDPDTTFLYNNVGPYLAGMLVQRRSGCDLIHYLMPRLFVPLGIHLPTWEMDPLGNSYGAGGLFLNIDELAKFGQLLLQDGSWNGKQLIPADWVHEAGRKQVDNGEEGYGYLFWMGPHGSFRADGKYGQFVIVMKDVDAVVTIMSESRTERNILNAVFDELYPQLRAGD